MIYNQFKKSQLVITKKEFYWNEKSARYLEESTSDQLRAATCSFFDDYFNEIFDATTMCNYLYKKVNTPELTIVGIQMIRLIVNDFLISNTIRGYIGCSEDDSTTPLIPQGVETSIDGKDVYLSNEQLADMWLNGTLTDVLSSIHFQSYLVIRPEHLIPIFRIGENNIFFQVSQDYPLYYLIIPKIEQDKGTELFLYVHQDAGQTRIASYYMSPDRISQFFPLVHLTDSISHCFLRRILYNELQTEDNEPYTLEDFTRTFLYHYNNNCPF